MRVKPYPIPFSMRPVIQKEIDDMLELGVIRPSNSPYAAPPVIVKKPDGSNRVCINFQKLNDVTVFDGEPMPNADDIFIAIKGKKFLSKADLTKGYWQIQMEEESIPKTAFVVPGGVYECTRLPFGLKNSAAAFNRVMKKVLGNLKSVSCFIDDIVVYTDTWKEHVEVWRELLRRLRKAGLTVKPSKCIIGVGEMDFLGHKVSCDVITPRKEKVDEILKVSPPTTKSQVRSFLGMVGYYQKFIPRYAEISKPLTDLTKGKQPNHVIWGQSQESAFQDLKKAISQCPILKILDTSREMVVQTDASSEGLGAVLLQDYDGTLHPVRYLSRKLKDAERNYSTIERECLAIVWAIDKLRVYLYGVEFVLLTDHKPLTYLSQKHYSNARVMRWAMFLQDWAFRIESIKGVDNVLADYLSRA